MKISSKEFVKLWQEADSISEVVEKTGMKYSAVTGRAAYLRSKGIPLKMYRSGVEKVDFDELAEYAKSFTKDQ